ncbi:MAG: B12-binding domain-containing radical SAM protein [Anaerolineae bacterium]|nr:B12-binding domain-containing radical SAM protein [Anaerolineae bacterium]
MTDILLVHAYVLADDPHERQVMKPYPPLGVLSLSAYLKRQGFSVEVFDGTFQSLADFPSALARTQPSVVGVYVNLMTKFNALKVVQMAKESGAWVVLGGPEPPYYAKDYLEAGADVIVVGEGELTMEALSASLIAHGRRDLHDIAGIAFLGDDGQLVETPAREMIKDLSALPWPDREAIDIRAYLNTWKTHHGRASMSVIHARGCPYTCRWCSHSVYGNSHRRRTPEDAAAELLHLKEAYDPDLIWYADDVFAINHRWLRAYADALQARGVRIPFECISRADRLTEPIVALLAEMGCFRLWNGSESGSQRVLDAMDRRVDAADVRAKTHLLQQYGIEAGMFIMLGYPGETVEDIEETTRHLKISNPDIFLTTVAYPIKGTPFYTEVESRILTDKPWDARTDRDLTVGGRYSRRFYSFATRWMVSSVALHRARTRGGVPLRRQVKLAVNVAIGRVGMLLTQGGREGG